MLPLQAEGRQRAERGPEQADQRGGQDLHDAVQDRGQVHPAPGRVLQVHRGQGHRLRLPDHLKEGRRGAQGKPSVRSCSPF